MDINGEWALEFKIVRPFGDNDAVAENWPVNMLHPYEGNTSLIGDAIKLSNMAVNQYKGLVVIGFEHLQPKIILDPLTSAFELIVENVIGIKLGSRIEERRIGLVHPEHQVVRIIGWELIEEHNE